MGKLADEFGDLLAVGAVAVAYDEHLLGKDQGVLVDIVLFPFYRGSISFYLALVDLGLIFPPYVVFLLVLLYNFIERHPYELFVVFRDLLSLGRRLVDSL